MNSYSDADDIVLVIIQLASLCDLFFGYMRDTSISHICSLSFGCIQSSWRSRDSQSLLVQFSQHEKTPRILVSTQPLSLRPIALEAEKFPTKIKLFYTAGDRLL
jgi:hypothetical protein